MIRVGRIRVKIIWIRADKVCKPIVSIAYKKDRNKYRIIGRENKL